MYITFGKSYDTNTSDSIKIPNQEFSLMHYLYDHHIIRKKIFAYKQLSKTKGILYLGETGLNYTKHYPKCRAKAKKEESLSVYILYLWTCDIKQMFGVWKGKRMQNSETKINYKMMFDTGANAILLPRALYHDAIDYYSKSSEGQCDYLVNSETLLCKSEIDLTSLVNITFDMGEFNITFLPQDIFVQEVKKENVYYSKIMSWDENIIVLGTNVLKRYITIYNMDEQTVGVVDNKEYVQKLPIRKKNPFIFVHS